MVTQPPAAPASDSEKAAEKPRIARRTIAIIAIVVIVAVAELVILSGSSSSLRQSTTVYVDSSSTCKALTTTFSCTVLLDANSGSTVTASMVKSMSINGTSVTPTVGTAGKSVSVAASLPIEGPGCISGCPPQAGINNTPKEGIVVVDLNDGTEVSVTLGAGGIIR